jgi:Mn2+/Fe2+ NRAMP family transporter
VTTAASAGSSFRFSLLWTLLFSTVACFVLQESSARLTVVSGRNLGEAIRDRSREGWRASVVLLAVFGTIFLGCAAYEAGNILGGVAGGVLATDLPPRVLTLASGFGGWRFFAAPFC